MGYLSRTDFASIGRRNNFDLLRLCAAGQVVWAHASTHLALRTPAIVVTVFRTFPGVSVFFIISGFLISMSYERSAQKGALGSYVRNRVLRIYPALWIALLVGILSVVVFGSRSLYGARPAAVAQWLLAHATFFQYYNPLFLREYGVGALNGSLWTIPVELEFYAFLPLLYIFLRLGFSARANVALAVVFAGAVAFHVAFMKLPSAAASTSWYKLVNVSLGPHLYVFLIGVLLQRNIARLRTVFAGRALWWIALYALGCLLALQRGWTESELAFPVPLMLLLACMLVSCALTLPGLTQRVLRGRDLSYGTYLYHMLVINALAQLGLRGAGWPAGLAATAVTILLAYASWTWIEAPALALRARFADPFPLADAV